MPSRSASVIPVCADSRRGRSPAAIVGKLNSALVDILATADMRDAMLRQSFVAESSSPDGLAKRIAADMTKWRGLVAASAGLAKP